ncbi:CRISPR-associated RAMP protein [Scytonema hofmannii FACHB-248]|uniref:CRISPR-associated RAMP protein n=1 Tax=Scytonema hofmannii FACHB-248 TaxID=1842502 RepID=A0ABR8GKX8_9CYAN|nr:MULTISPECIES: CRISPR-associated RAMP protein Csx7 [Nostocales]MBD2603862.1 CRISPR-associated RAMP protein [Scytonema hofmannii FACHB-248]
MFEIFKNRLEITGILETVTALRISAGRSTEPIGSDLPVIKDALNRPLIPGSSFKGALRSRLESFLRGIVGSNRKLVANPAIESEWSITPDEISQFKHETPNVNPLDRENRLHKYIIENTDLVSLLFGSPWLSSKLQIRDLTVYEPEDNWFGQYQERDGVSIDRDTETAADGKLYDFQVVPAGTPFIFHAVVENADDWELGLLMIGLHQFETEQIPLGGGRSRGLGVVKLKINDIKWVDVRDDNDKNKVNPNKVIEYLKKLSNSNENLPCDNTIPLPYIWSQALIYRLNEEIEKNKNTTNATH